MKTYTKHEINEVVFTWGSWELYHLILLPIQLQPSMSCMIVVQWRPQSIRWTRSSKATITMPPLQRSTGLGMMMASHFTGRRWQLLSSTTLSDLWPRGCVLWRLLFQIRDLTFVVVIFTLLRGLSKTPSRIKNKILLCITKFAFFMSEWAGAALFSAGMKLLICNRYDPLSACLVDFKGRANVASVKNFQLVVSYPEVRQSLFYYYERFILNLVWPMGGRFRG